MPLLPGASNWMGPQGHETGPAAGQHQGSHDIHSRLQHGTCPAGHAGAGRAPPARQTPSCLSSLGRSALTTSLRRTAGPRQPRSCSSRPPWITCSIQAERDSRGSSSTTWPASTPARPLSFTSCCASSRHKALCTYNPATWPSSAASRASSRRRRVPRLPAPSSMAPSTAWP